MIRSAHQGPASLRVVVSLGTVKGHSVHTMAFSRAADAIAVAADFRRMADQLEAEVVKRWPAIKNSLGGRALSPAEGTGGESSRFAPGLKFIDGRWQRHG
jgi:hypothetical protein